MRVVLPSVSFVDAHMRMSLARDLRQVRDAQHLRALAERAQLATDDFRDAAADAGVDFVEHQAGQRVGLRRGDLDREADARQFAAGSDFRERPGRLTRGWR